MQERGWEGPGYYCFGVFFLEKNQKMKPHRSCSDYCYFEWSVARARKRTKTWYIFNLQAPHLCPWETNPSQNKHLKVSGITRSPQSKINCYVWIFSKKGSSNLRWWTKCIVVHHKKAKLKTPNMVHHAAGSSANIWSWIFVFEPLRHVFVALNPINNLGPKRLSQTVAHLLSKPN